MQSSETSAPIQDKENVSTLRGDDVDFNFLNGTVFTDVSHGLVVDMAAGLTNNCEDDCEKAVVLFNWVRDNLTYKVGLYNHKASETLNKGWGSCSNKANALVAMLRAIGIPSGFRIMTVATRKYFGPLTPHRFTGFLSERSLHVHAFVQLENKWLKYDPTDDHPLSSGTAHMNPPSIPVFFDGKDHAELNLHPDHIFDGNDHPIPSLDNIFYKTTRLPGDALFAFNLYMDFGREFGKKYHNAKRYEQDFFSHFMSKHPEEYKKFVMLEAALAVNRERNTQQAPQAKELT